MSVVQWPSSGMRAGISLVKRMSSSSGTNSVIAAAGHNRDLRHWVQEQGGFVWSGLHVLHSTEADGLGVVATQDVRAGTVVIGLPRRVPLTMEMNAAISDLLQNVPEELWAMKLGVKLLTERAQGGSYWWPYISMLPKSFSLPVFFSGPEIENLDYVPVIHQIKKRCKFLLQFSKELSNAVGKLPAEKHPFRGQKVDSGALAWAMAAVSSRAFKTHNVTNSADSAMLLPLIDMCNHSFEPNAAIVEIPTKDKLDRNEICLQVVTQRDVKQGEQLTLNYGSLTNDLLLLDYGFVIPNNPYDVIELKYDGVLLDNARVVAGIMHSSVSQSFASPAHWQIELLHKLGLVSEQPQKVTLGGVNHVDGRLLAALRVLYANAREDVIDNDVEKLGCWDLKTANDDKVLRTLSALALILLNHFKTSVSEDETTLANNLQPTRLGTEFKLSKKKLLLNVLEVLKSKLKAMGT